MRLSLLASIVQVLRPELTDNEILGVLMTAEHPSIPAALRLTAREVSQVLREVIFERSSVTRACSQTWDEIYAGHFQVDIGGWFISIYNDCDELDYCEECVAPDGRRWAFDSGDRFGTDPIALLSTWELVTLEQILKKL
jgi:probable phosphoglycerate mutase